MFNTFTDVALRLGDLYKTRKGINIGLSHLDEDVRNRQIAITPKGGWLSDQPKSNAETREAEKDRVFAADETLQKIAKQQTELRDDLADIDADIEALEEMRDAMKWTVRLSLAESMRGAAITFIEHTVVEDASDAKQESAMFGDDVYPDDNAPKEDDGIAVVGETEDLPF